MRKLRALMRMTSVRLSAVFLTLFAIFAIVLVVYVTATAAGILQQQSRAIISDEIRELGGVYGCLLYTSPSPRD